MLNRPWIAVSAALLLAAPGAYADVGQGDFEAGIDISLENSETKNDDGTKDKDSSGNITVSGGYFYSDRLEAKLGVSLRISTQPDAAGNNKTTTSGTLNPGVDYLFGPGTEITIRDLKGNLVPFVGAAYALAVGDNADTDFLEAHAGLKFFFRERASLESKLSYLAPLDSNYDALTILHLGFNVYF